MAGDMSAVAIEILIQNLINIFKEERSLIRGLDGDAKQLQTTLALIQTYLNDAEKKSITQGAVTIWLNELEELAFEADNVLDELNYHILHKKFNKMVPKHKVLLSCFSSFNHIARRRNMALRIKQINTSFDSMNKKATDLGLQSMVMNAPPHVSLETDSFTIYPIFIGRDDDVPKLVEILLSESVGKQIFSILTIVGMGGMGKTTLTRKVFNHEKMKNRFGSLIWIHVSQIFDPIVLLKKILSTLTSSQTTSDAVEISREVVLKKLEEALKAKTYLLILDDVWNEDLSKWEDFVNAITGVTSTKGNGVIITTRNENVASLVRPLHVHPLNGLSDEECWSIIKAKTFEKGDVVPSEFEIVGRKVAKRCGGLPLAANVIGGVLRCKSEQEWRLINENWDSEGKNNISKILKLSFDNLSSPSLKKCFAYCSVFPKGYVINVHRLIKMWVAEGFLQSDEINEMESVGNKFVNVLLHNSLLIVGESDNFGNVEYCKMHDLVHDLATRVLGNDSNGLKQARYVMHNSYQSNPIPKEFAKYSRTLLLNCKISGIIFSDFESLHVLTINDFGVHKLPNSIRKLIHLRNLDISLTSIKNLPEWIGELHHLQTLRAEISYLKKLPSALKYLSNLRHLYIGKDTRLRAEIGRLTSLQTLRYFAVGDKKGYQIEELGSLKYLKGNLEIYNLEKVHGKEEAEKAKISEKRDLLGLTLRWDADREVEITNDESVLEGLQPHPNMRKLEIYGFKGKKFPWWIQKMAVLDGPQGSWIELDKLISITLSYCDQCEEIPRLDHLSNLQKLSLRELKKVRFINSSFNKLTTFNVYGLHELECLPDWLFYNNQNLSSLYIIGCPKLEKLPDGLHTLNSLEHLSIKVCPNLKSMGNSSDGGQSQLGILKTMEVERCESLMELPHQMVESSAQSLETLKLEKVRFINSSFNRLKSFSVHSLQELECLPDWLFYNNQNLSSLTIFDCPKLEKLPDGLHTLNSLEHLSIRECPNLKSMGNSSDGGQSQLGILKTMEVERCESLMELPHQMVESSVQSLETLKLEKVRFINSSFNRLKSFSVHSLQELECLPDWLFYNNQNLSSLYIFDCPKLEKLPDGLHTLNSLEHLSIKECPNLKSMWNSSDGGQSQLGILKTMEVERCESLMELPHQMVVSSAQSLETLKLEKVRFINSSFNRLKSFSVHSLHELECLPIWLFYNNQNLSSLYIIDCPKLEKLPDGLHTLNSLKYLRIKDCPNLKSMGNSSGGGQSQIGILKEMKIQRCESLMELPHQMVESSAQSLETLKLVGLSSVKNLAMVIDCLAKSARSTPIPLRLQRLYIDVDMETSGVVMNKESVDDILQGCSNSLTILKLRGMENWEGVPTSIQHLTRLIRLELINFGFEELSDWFGNLLSLHELHLRNCKKLRSLPTADSLRLLCKSRYDLTIKVRDCPELHIDSEVHHIPKLQIDYE